MGHPRHDQDNKKRNCLTFDCAFHPKAFEVASGSSKFQKLLCDTAVTAANTVLQPQGEQLSEDYKLLRNLKCKGGTPGSIMVSEHRMQNPNEPVPAREKTYKLSEEGPKLYKELMATQMKESMNEGIKKQKEEEEEKERGDEELKEEEERGKMEEEGKGEEKSVGITQPKFKVTYSSPVDLGEFIDSRVKAYRRPKNAVVTIQAPQLVRDI